MTKSIAAARETARTSAGKFGTQPMTKPDLELDVMGFRSAPRTVALPDPTDHLTLTSFVGEEVARHRQDAHGGDPVVRFDGAASSPISRTSQPERR